jgi:predicted AAA+ superfamily ATPase
MLNGQTINAQNIAREATISRSSVDVYFSIMTDTLLGHFLQPYRPNIKVREQTHPKFYWFDTGAARAAAGMLFDPVDTIWQGYALETIVFHELRVYNHANQKNREISFYRTASGSEIDFIIETAKRSASSPARVVCIEVKLSTKWKREWERAMRSFKEESSIIIDKMIGIYMGEQKYHFGDLEILPLPDFLSDLYAGKIF